MLRMKNATCDVQNPRCTIKFAGMRYFFIIGMKFPRTFKVSVITFVANPREFCVCVQLSVTGITQICNRSSDNNLSAKTKWQNGVTHGAESCQLVSWRNSRLFEQGFVVTPRSYIGHHLVCSSVVTRIQKSWNKEKPSPKLLLKWFIQMKKVFARTPNDKILHLESHLSAILFSCRIVIPKMDSPEHYNDVIMSAIASQITSFTIV